MWDFWPFSATRRRLDEHGATLARILKAQTDQATMVAAIFSRMGVVMTTLAELKELVTQVVTENNESFALALAKIEELTARIPDPSDVALADSIAAALRNQITANDEFQARLNAPPPDPPA